MSIRVHLVILIVIGAIMGIALSSFQRHEGKQRNELERAAGQSAIAQARLSVAEDTIKTFLTTCDLYLATQQALMQPSPSEGHENSARALKILNQHAFSDEQESLIKELQQHLEAFKAILEDPIFNHIETASLPRTPPTQASSNDPVVTDVTFDSANINTGNSLTGPSLHRYELLTEKMVQGFVELRERMDMDFNNLQTSVAIAEKSDSRGFVLTIFLSIVISALLLQWAHKQISTPIVNIATDAEAAIAQEHSYTGVNKGTKEVRQLNHTLTKLINSLENLVTTRTKELSRQTETLQQEITRRAAAESDLLKAIDDAEAASRAKSAFLAMMSHEIRTPMNGVVGFTELLLDTELTTQQKEYSNTVKSSAQNLLRILNDILDFSKIESGKLDFEMAPFSLESLLKESDSLMMNSATLKGLELRISTDHQLPQNLVGDAIRLRQILINLIGNAIKFTSAGRVTVDVRGERVSRDSRDQWKINFFVADTGVGMTPELQSQLFNPFSQGDASITRRFGGTGLGLAISKRLVEMMNGEISVESEPGKGSQFHFFVMLEASNGKPHNGA